MEEDAPIRRKLSALDMIEHNRYLRTHWIVRAIASLIDFLIVLIPALAIGFLLRNGGFNSFLIITNVMLALFWVFYSAIMEYLFGFTLGKKAMRLRVQSLKGPLYLWKAILRNISKVQAVILLIDALLGMAMGGDPRQKFFDRLAETTVIRERKGRKAESEHEI